MLSKWPISGPRIQAATTAAKTAATLFSGVLMGPISRSMSATTCCSVDAKAEEKGNETRVRMTKAAARSTSEIGTPMAIHSANVTLMPKFWLR